MNPHSSQKTVNLWGKRRNDSLGSIPKLPSSKVPVRIHNFLGTEIRHPEAIAENCTLILRRNSDFKPYRISDNKLNLRRKSIAPKTPSTLRESLETVRSRRSSHDFTQKASKTRLRLFLDDENSSEIDDQITFLKENVIDRLVAIS